MVISYVLGHSSLAGSVAWIAADLILEQQEKDARSTRYLPHSTLPGSGFNHQYVGLYDSFTESFASLCKSYDLCGRYLFIHYENITNVFNCLRP
jgi:hypothetical protein